ncbi:MAG: type II toxin-antitoxin system PemK/MazF family toxin [Gammaproteobacteria bacterium]
MPTWWPAPEPGDIVWCHFPQVPGNPGPKPRPALVLRVDDSHPGEPWVEVVYGTSQKTASVRSGELLISKATNLAAYRQAGLSFDTKFDFKQVVRLPFHDEWFDRFPGLLRRTPVMGSLHASLIRSVQAAYRAANSK